MTRTLTVLLLALAACTSTGADHPGPAESSNPGQPAPGGAQLEFSARQGGDVSQPGARAQGGSGRITVEGSLSAPDPCRKVTGALERSGSELTLRVSVAAGGAEVCAQMIAGFAYTAAVSGLAPGTYTLRVVHTYPGTGWETTTVLNERVAVR